MKVIQDNYEAKLRNLDKLIGQYLAANDEDQENHNAQNDRLE